MDQISWEDKELTVAGTWLLELATFWTHKWSIERIPEDQASAKNSSKVIEVFGDKERVKEVSDEIYQAFLDDCFGNSSRTQREDFIREIETKC